MGWHPEGDVPRQLVMDLTPVASGQGEAGKGLGTANPSIVPLGPAAADPETQEGHAGDGGRRLTVGSSRCRCCGCGRFFGGVVTFDLHQHLTPSGELVCLDDDDLRRRGLRLVAGWWVRPYPAQRLPPVPRG